VVVVVVVVVAVVVVVVTTLSPQLGKLASLPEYHFPLRSTSAWNRHVDLAGMTTINRPEVPDSVPTRVPSDHRFRVHVVPGGLPGPIRKVDFDAESVGGRVPAEAHDAIARIPTRIAPQPTRSRFISLLLARRDRFC
jgi:hypothetical protein